MKHLIGERERPPFASSEGLRAQFERGLEELLSGYDELSTFILVLANAGFDPVLWEALGPRLEQRFQALLADVRQRHGHSGPGSA